MKKLYITISLMILLNTIGISNKNYPQNETKNTNNSGAKIMGLNPASQNQGGGFSGGGGSGGGGGGWGDGPITQTFSSPRESSSSGFPSDAPTSGGKVKGATTELSNNISRPAAVDPYAKYGGADKYRQLISGFDSQKAGIFDTAREAAGEGARGIRGSILDFIDQYKSGQDKINQSSVNNELNKRRGVEGVMGMVGRGIRSGGVMLANKNASDSSAAGAIARAYGDVGGREMRNVGNQYETQNQEIGLQQEDLGRQAANYSRDYEDNKESMVNSITSQARQSLAALDAAMMDADLPERIAIEQERAKVKSLALKQLSQYDQMLAKQRGSVKALTPEERAARAGEMQTAGYDLNEGAFDFTDQAPMQAAGPYASELPIFTMPRSRREA